MHHSNMLFGLLGLFGLSVATPHEGMVNNDKYRDVGVIFGKENFKGESKFLLMDKSAGECMSLAILPNRGVLGFGSKSVQICTTASCILYSTENCDCTGDAFTVKVDGPVDVPHRVELVDPITGDSRFKSYMCRPEGKATAAESCITRTIQAQPDFKGHAKSEPDHE